jgi:Xaa-Pro dipeptidase
MEMLRTVKSEEELQVLARAAKLGDLMLTTCRDIARPGVTEAKVYAGMMEAMLANGGEEPTLFLWACDALPYPHPFRLPTMRPIARGDLIICEIHPKIGGYYTHVERTFSLGDARPEQHRIYDGCFAAYEEGMKNFGPGRPISVAMDRVRDVIHARGLGMCETGIHGHGLASLEYPRYRHHALKADQAALKKLGDEFRAGMVFAFNIDLFDPTFHDGKTGCVFAETVVITETGARRLHDYPTEFQTIPI